MVLCFSNSLSSFIQKGINLLFLSIKILTYPHIIGNIKTNGLITLCKYSINTYNLFQLILRYHQHQHPHFSLVSCTT